MQLKTEDYVYCLRLIRITSICLPFLIYITALYHYLLLLGVFLVSSFEINKVLKLNDKKRITKQQLYNFLKSKSCNTPYNIYISKNLLEDEEHPLSKLNPEDFSLRHIFEYITIVDDKD